MSMEEIPMPKVKFIAKKFGLTPIKIKGTSQVNIAKYTDSAKYELISWEEFEAILEQKGLSVYKARESCFLKLMKSGKAWFILHGNANKRLLSFNLIV